MTRPAPPTDPAAFACIKWDGYRPGQLSHWAWAVRYGPRTFWLTFCGQKHVVVRAAGVQHVCAICTRGYAKIRAQHDADHSQGAAADVESSQDRETFPIKDFIAVAFAIHEGQKGNP